jgi:putative transposase
MIIGQQYHLFNHANGRENLFVEEKNYAFFLEKLSKHILPVCKIFSYCLMPNHFHLVLQVRYEEELQKLWQKPGSQTIFTQKQLELKISKSFANLFSSYTQSFNKVYNRMGSLFIPSMKMEEITDINHFCKAIHYSHANPVHHGFTKKIEDWPNSSYKIFLSKGATKLEREYVLEMFGGMDAFIKYHNQPICLKQKFIE